MKSGQVKYCDKCNGAMEEKLLFTSYYFECKKCAFAKDLSNTMGIKVTQKYADGKSIEWTPDHKVTLPPGHTIPNQGSTGRTLQAHPGLAAPYGQTPNPYLYPRDKPSECNWCAHKLACSCISFLVNGKKHHHVLINYIEGVFLQAGDYLEFKDSYLNYTVPAKGMYLIKNDIGVPTITVQP